MCNRFFHTEKIRDIVALECGLDDACIRRYVIGDHSYIPVSQVFSAVDETLYRCTDILHFTVHIPRFKNPDIVRLRSFFRRILLVTQYMGTEICDIRRNETITLRALSQHRFLAEFSAYAFDVLICLVDRLKKRESACGHVIGSKSNTYIFS
ncbi:MAG: hypothetical protein BWZ04_01909 [Firmicutes bacterium ADurb.BinA205]|nr:MAG: hypothetical protein BWZ04_01909 [Firmicutes bacterium ADurb.BinA205]